MVIERSRESQRESVKINKNIRAMFRLEFELFFFIFQSFLRIAIMGSTGVGKTSFISRLLDNCLADEGLYYKLFSNKKNIF